MINNPTFRDIFTNEEGYLLDFYIMCSDGSVIDREMIVDDNINILESLNSEEQLVYGSCEASCFTAQLSTATGNLIGKFIKPYFSVIEDAVYLTDEEGNRLTNENGELLTIKNTPALQLGVYYVYEDTPEGEKPIHTIKAYDAIYGILQTDVTDWYENLYKNNISVTVKMLRDSFFRYFGISQVNTTLILDDYVIAKKLTGRVSGFSVIKGLCEANGVFGHIDRNGNFVYVSLAKTDSSSSKDYDFYENESVTFSDYLVNEITEICLVNNDEYTRTPYGTEGNTYYIEDNYIFNGLINPEGALELLFDKVAGISYRPVKGRFAADLTVEVGDKFSFETNVGTTVNSIVLERSITGISGLVDEISVNGNEKYKSDISINDYALKVLSGQNVLKINNSGEIVEASVTGNPDNGNIVKIKAENIDFIAENAIQLSSKSLSIVSKNFNVSPDGAMSCSSANITGGSIHMETTNVDEDTITLNHERDSVIADFDKEINSATLSPRGIHSIKTQKGSTPDVISEAYFDNSTNGESRVELGIAKGTEDEYLSQRGIKGPAYKFWANENEANFRIPVYMADDPIITSDKNAKRDIEALDKEESASFIYALKPTKYRLINGTSGRYHHGLIAQEVKEVMPEDFGLYTEKDIVNHEQCGLRYGELIADLIATVQKQHEEIEMLKKLIKGDE